MENIIFIARKMFVIFLRKKKLSFLLYAESLYEYRGESRNLKSVSVPGAAIVVSHMSKSICY